MWQAQRRGTAGRSVTARRPRGDPRRAARAHRGRARGHPVPRPARRRRRPAPARARARYGARHDRSRHANDVALEWDTEVSRLHAELECLGGEWTVADDGLSRNGSFLNGQRISGRQRLRDGDVLRVGRTQIAYRVPESAESSPTVAAGSRPELPELSATQRAVLAALCRPYKDTELATPATNQQIAEELYLSIDAVKAHLRTLFGYFGVQHLPQNQKRSYLAMRALQDGVVSRRDL